jgi:hypothetical protein
MGTVVQRDRFTVWEREQITPDPFALPLLRGLPSPALPCPFLSSRSFQIHLVGSSKYYRTMIN